MKKFILLTFVLSVMVLALGCEKKPEGIPDLNSCTLTITMDGQPLEEAVVAMVPESQQTWYVCGVTDASGVSPMKTNGQYNGAPEGKFKVTVEKMAGDPNWKPKTDEERERGEVLKSVVKSTYGNAATTDLECTVVSGKNAFTFDVKSAKSKK